jgi:hypothetical protein
MNINSIQFDNFITEFYSNNSNKKMIINLGIESDNEIEPNIYDIHTMLLDLIIKGCEIFNLNVSDYNICINKLQPYFLNINIRMHINNYSKLELIKEDSPYINRYIRISNDNLLMTINGAHKIVNTLFNIKSFYLIDSNCNLCISFDFIV